VAGAIVGRGVGVALESAVRDALAVAEGADVEVADAIEVAVGQSRTTQSSGGSSDSRLPKAHGSLPMPMRRVTTTPWFASPVSHARTTGVTSHCVHVSGVGAVRRLRSSRKRQTVS
jgi:hypothetical protein